MNRLFAYLSALILLLCGCTAGDDTTPAPAPDGSIRFDVQAGAKTRGSVIGGTTLPTTESFRVYAWKSLGGVTTVMMTRDATDTESNVVSNTTGQWVPKKRYYWPDEAGATVSFYAVYPKDFTVTEDGGDCVIDFTIPAAVASQHDMMVAKTEDLALASTTNGAAPLTFGHITSQVSFRAKLATAFTGWRVDVRGVRLCNVNSRGTYSYGSGTVTPASPAALLNYDLVMAASSVAVTSTAETVALTSASDVAMLMPQTLTPWDRETETSGSFIPSTTGSYVAISCVITEPGGDVAFSGNTYVPLPAEWAPANNYIYTLEFGSGYSADGELSVTTIALSCTISEWGVGEGATEEMIL